MTCLSLLLKQHRRAGSERSSGSFTRALPCLRGLPSPWLAQGSGSTKPGNKTCPDTGEGINQPARFLLLVIMKKKETDCLGFSVQEVFHPNLLTEGSQMIQEATLPINLHLLTFFFISGQD